MRKLLYIIAWGISATLCSCARSDAEQPANGKVTVGFCATLSVQQSAASRAAVNIPSLRTVRIIVRQSVPGATGPDISRQIVDNRTYYVYGTTTLLTERPVNPTTYAAASSPVVLPMTLAPGFYDIYAISPAIPLNEGDTTVTVKNNIDFMSSRMFGVHIGPVNKTDPRSMVTLPPMKRHCAAVAFADIYSPDYYIKGYFATLWPDQNRPAGFFVNDIYKWAHYSYTRDCLYYTDETPIGRQYMQVNHYDADGATNANVVSYVSGGVFDYRRLLTGTNGTNSAYNKEFYFLPNAADNPVSNNKIAFNLDIKFHTGEIPETLTPAVPLITSEISGPFKSGVRTSYSIKVASKEAHCQLTINGEIIGWASGGEHSL